MLISSPAARAEVTLDGTLGPSGPLAGPDYVVSDDLGQLRGPNLFHSFGKFNINTGESATFTGPTTVVNILGRVTGGSASLVDGRLSSQIPGANLYLINPSGLMFGPNATLDISGSFHATTADYIGLADGGRFDATLPSSSVLTAAPPEAFGFLNGNPAGLSIDKSTLSVPSAETVSLIGGEVEISGDPELNPFEVDNVAAPGGRVNIVSVAAAGEVVPNASVATPDIAVDGFQTLGKIRISDGALVNTSDESGGTVVIRGGQLVLDEGAVFADTQGDIDGAAVGVDIDVSDALSVVDGGVISTEAIGAGDAGDIQVTAGDVEIKRAPDTGPTLVWSAASGSGDTGNITVETDHLTIDRGALSTPTFGSGKSGDITIEAESVHLKGAQEFFSGIFVNTFGGGAGGSLELRTADFRMTDRAWIQANGLGSGEGGRIGLTANTIELRGGSQIAASGFFGEGLANAGTIEISTDRLSIIGLESAGDPFGSNATGIFAGVKDGNGGKLRIVANDSVTLTQRASMGSSSYGEGRAGQFQLMTRSLELLDGSQLVGSAFGTGNGADFVIHADAVKISGVHDQPLTDILGRESLAPSGLASQSGINGGDGGTIRITARSIAVLDGAQLTTTTFGPGNGGSIELNTDQLVVAGENALHRNFLIDKGIENPDGARATISTGSQSDVLGVDATGNAGVITIRTGELALSERGLIGSNTTGPGVGGTIDITADNVRLSSKAGIEARSRSLVPAPGNAGTIRMTVSDTFESSDSLVLTQADDADGGNIEISAGNLLYLLNDSAISATVGGGAGDGGNVVIDPRFVVLNRSRVTANAFGGAGGNILIVADNFLASADSAVTASSEFGVDGQIVIRSPEDTVIVGVEALPESFLDVSSLLSERCAARTAAKVGSFVVLGRGGVPPEPDAALPSFYADSDTQTDTRSTSSSTDSHAAGRGAVVVDTGQRRVSGAQAVNSIMPARLLFSCGD